MIDHGRERERAEIEENQDYTSNESWDWCAKRREDEGNGKAYEWVSYEANKTIKWAWRKGGDDENSCIRFRSFYKSGMRGYYKDGMRGFGKLLQDIREEWSLAN